MEFCYKPSKLNFLLAFLGLLMQVYQRSGFGYDSTILFQPFQGVDYLEEYDEEEEMRLQVMDI